MPDPSRHPGVPYLTRAGLALCLVASAGTATAATTRSGVSGYGPGARPVKVWPAKTWRAQPGQTGTLRTKPAPKAKPADSKPDGTADAKAGGRPPSNEPASAWTSGEQDRTCFRSRRKLWQDGEGWVVKKVSVCP